MTPYDGAMAAVIVAGMVWGAFKGITWQLASILSLVLGYTVSQTLSVQAAPYFPGEPVVARALAMIALYLATSGGIFVVAWLIRATLKRLQFEAYDRHLGMVLGGVEGALLGMVATLFVVSLAPQTRAPIFESKAGKVVATVMNTVGPVLPAEARQVLRPFLDPEHAATAPVAESEDPAPPEKTAARGKAAPRPAAPATRAQVNDPETTPASFADLLEESERRIGRAVIDGAAASLKNVTKDTPGDARKPDRAVKRR